MRAGKFAVAHPLRIGGKFPRSDAALGLPS